MKILIYILSAIMGFLLLNIIGYSMSEDYRFFLKKIKYQEEVVYDSTLQVDDTNRMSIIDTTPEKILENKTIQTSGTGFTYLDTLGKDKKITPSKVLPELSPEQEDFLNLFESFSLKEVKQHSSLFGLTQEYPDPYYEFESAELSLYIFPTKTYSEVQKIFTILEYEIPFTINETNSFGEASFFINLDPSFTDDHIRLVLEYEKNLFGLKIKKDSYNSFKEGLNSLSQSR